MQEKSHGVERLLNAIHQNVDDSNIKVLADILNYYEPQLREDIEAIKYVNVINKDE